MSDTPRRKTATQPPVSAHPAFPVIVGLWFAALFGIGSMVLPLALFERFATSSGLAGVYAAAQPPLGATARIIVAVSAALAGALAGLFVARRIAAANDSRTVTRRAAALRSDTDGERATKRPISAHEELGTGSLDEDLDAPRDLPRPRRRSLAVPEDSARSDFLSFAPLPGQDPHAAPEPINEPIDAPIDEPFDLPLDLVATEAPVAESEFSKVTEIHTGRFGTANLSAPPPAPGEVFVSFAAPEPVDERPAFLRQERADEQPTEPAPVPELAQPMPVQTVQAAPLNQRPLAELGVVELVERFAQALERHKAAAPVISEDANPAPAPAAADPVPADPPRQIFAPAGALPTALQPFGFDDEEDMDEQNDGDDLPDLDLTAALSRSRIDFAAPLAHAPEDDAEEIGDAEAEAGYTSLLAMKSPFGLPREPVRIDDEDAPVGEDEIEPVVVFPGQATREFTPAPTFAPAQMPAQSRPFDAPVQRAEAAVGRAAFGQPGSPPRDAGETERALRDALEKLQRLSGAA